MDLGLGPLHLNLRRPAVSRRATMTALVLAIVFSVAVTIRAYAAKYGFYLNEFDPYYDYYAANHIVTLAQQHGLFYALFNNPQDCGTAVLTSCHSLQGYFNWHDVTTWFPYGRNVAASSQDGLQVGGALLYLLAHNIFGAQISLYDFLILLPVLFGAITSVLFFFLVRRIAGDAAGLFSAMMVAVSPPLIQRGNLGWFKSEPLAILLFVAASYVVLTVFDKERSLRSRVLRGLSAGFLAGYASTAWGGGDYFSAAFGLMFLLLPFMNLDLSSLSPAIISFTAADLFASAIFPRPGVGIVTNPVGLALIGGTVFVLLAQWSKTWVKPAEYRRTLVKFVLAFVLAGLAVISFGFVGGISVRYLSVIAPWARSGNALVQSVAEQSYPTGQDYFTSYLMLLSFGVAGALVAFRRRSIPMVYALIIGLTGLYFSAAFSRLLVYSSVALGLLGGIGFAELAFALVKPSTTPLVKKKPVYTTRNEMKVVFSVAMIALIAIPAGTYWIPNPIQCSSTNSYFCDQSPADSGVSLANGATAYSRSPFNDWIQTLNWIRQDTPTNAVVISWWDYGYWITVMGNRTSAADNSTINGTRIAQIGRMFMSNATAAAATARKIAGDRPVYVLLFITGSILPTSAGSQYYILQVPAGGGFTAGGGDESKKQWFIRIGGLNESQYLECPSLSATCTGIDDYNLTPFALQNSLFSNLLPFRFSGYLQSQSSSSTGQTQIVLSPSYAGGTVEAFSYPAQYLFGTNSTGPFRLAYASPSMSTPSACPGNSGINCFNAILVYQVTH
ncbi:MAG: glycosyltransferase family 39 protein [Nitrososphaerales archaeon]|nr:glycosyltransferase family 39 protein [Nitrososphaerales archaeon]